MHKRLLVSLTLLAASGCVAQRASNVPVPKERASECKQICEDIDMQLSAVVVIMSSAGCVCEPRGADGTPQQSSGGAAAAGGAAIHAAAEAARQQRNNNNR